MTGADHAHEHDHEGEAFPRQALTRLVGDEELARAGRERLQVWALGGALALLALGLPSERVTALDPTVWGGHPLLERPVRAVAALLSRSYESVWFLVSAIGWGLALPALASLVRRIGFAHGTALFSALIALAAPIAWRGATLPGTFGAGILGASLLAGALFAIERRGSALRVASLFFLACVLCAEHLWLLPAVLLAWRGRPRAERRAGITLALVAAAAFVLALYASTPARRAWFGAEALGDTRERVLGALGVPLFGLAGLAVAAWGVIALFDPRRRPEESPPPAWIVPWCGAFVFALLPGHPGGHPLGTWLVPVAAIGLADFGQRAWREERIVPRGLALLAVQVAVTAALHAYSTRSDPLAEWRALARQHLEPDDWVWTHSEDRLHLLTERWELDAHGPRESEAELAGEALRARAARRRAVADVALAREGEPKTAPADPRLRAALDRSLTSRGVGVSVWGE